MLKVCWWLQGRLFQLWHYVRDQTEQIEKIGPPYTFYFYFFILFFVIFCNPVLRWHGPFFDFFCIFFYVYKYWASRYRKKKEKEESSHRPATGIFVRKDRHTVWTYVKIQLTFSCGLPIWRLIPVYCGCHGTARLTRQLRYFIVGRVCIYR